MATEQQKKQFFAFRPVTHTVRMGGQKLAFANLPKDIQVTIKERLAEKDSIVNQGFKGVLPGIKIDGREVTTDNLHEFEVAKMPEPKEIKEKVKEVKPEKEKSEKEPKKVERYTLDSLKSMTFKALKAVGSKFGTTDRSKSKLIKEILDLQDKK